MKKMEKQVRRLVRAGIQMFFFLMAPAVFTTAFSGVKYIFNNMGSSQLLEWAAFLKVLAGICLFTMIFGRYFCGFACAFGSFGDLMYALGGQIQKKTHKKWKKIPENWIEKGMYVKYLVLAGAAVCCFLGVYEKFQGTSPWDVFSMVTALRLPGIGYSAGILLLLAIMAGMCMEERFFCKFLCPMGAVFALLPVLPFSSYRRSRDNCIPRCAACQKQCPARISIDGDSGRSGECLQCNKCLDVCPRGNIGTGIRDIKGNEWWFLLAKGVILLALLFILGGTRI